MPQQSLWNQILSFFAWLASKIRRHPFLWLGGTAVLVGVLGWAMGTWSTCGQRCGFDTALFSAWGGWVGGLATTAAFGITAYELVASRKREEKLNEQRAEVMLAKARNVRVYLKRFIGFGDPIGERFPVEPRLMVAIENRAGQVMTDVRVLLEGGKREAARVNQINQMGLSEFPFTLWADNFSALDLGLERNQDRSSPPDEEKADLRVEFKMGGYWFRWTRGEIEPIDAPDS